MAGRRLDEAYVGRIMDPGDLGFLGRPGGDAQEFDRRPLLEHPVQDLDAARAFDVARPHHVVGVPPVEDDPGSHLSLIWTPSLARVIASLWRGNLVVPRPYDGIYALFFGKNFSISSALG